MTNSLAALVIVITILSY